MPVTGKRSSGPSREWKQYLNKTNPKPKKVTFTTGNTSAKAPSRFRTQTQTKKQAVSHAFTTILFIVLFVFFSGILIDIEPPVSRESVSTPELATAYIREHANDIGSVAFDSILTVTGFMVAITKPVEFITTNIATVSNGLFSILDVFNWEYQTELGTVYIPFDELPWATRFWLGPLRITYNLIQNPGPNLTNEQYWALEQYRSSEIIYPCELFDETYSVITQLNYDGVCA